MHQEMKEFTKKCMELYKKYPALYATDCNPEGFKWINSNDRNNSICSFLRLSANGKKNLLFVLNFTPVVRDNFRVGVPAKSKYKLVLGSDEKNQQRELVPVKEECDGYEYSILVDVKRFGVTVYEFNTTRKII